MIKQLEKLQVRKSPGVYGIRLKLLCETRIEIGEALANLFKKSFNSELPMDWKDVVVLPLFKKDVEAHMVTTESNSKATTFVRDF